VSSAEIAATFERKRILVTGGLGFIGSSLAHELVVAGADVVLVDSLAPAYGGNRFNIADIEDRVTVHVADIRDAAMLSALVLDSDVIFNLAGQTSHLDSMRDPFTDLEINCVSQLSLLETCRMHNPEAIVVFGGTRQVYGRPQYLPVDERHPIVPVDVNGINKAAGEWYHLLYARVYGLPLSVLRLTNTYGPRMRVRDARQTFLGKWLRAVITGEELVVFGDGTQRRDFTFVDDAVRALLLAAGAEHAMGEVFNLGDDRVVSLLELAQLMIEINGGGSFRVEPFPPDRLAIDIGDYYGDFTKASEVLGWRPSVPLEDGLERSLAYYREHGSRYWDDG
jgi:UDP-glucose 4-epimerase